MLRVGSETQPCSRLLVPKATWGGWVSTRQAGSAQGNPGGLGQHKASWVSTRQPGGIGSAQGNLGGGGGGVGSAKGNLGVLGQHKATWRV